MIYASCGAICHRCAMGDWVRSSRDTSDDLTMRRLIDLRTRPEYQPEQLKFNEASCEYLVNNRGWCEPRQLPGGVVAAWRRRLGAKHGQRGVPASVPADRRGEGQGGTGAPSPLVVGDDPGRFAA
jgi:hypothetical protein